MNLGNYMVPDDTANGICVDVGGNFGDFTNKYKNHFSEIHVLEPQIVLFEQIKTRFNDNTNIFVYNNAVWSEPNVTLEMVSHSNTDLGSVGVKNGEINDDWTNDVVNKVVSTDLNNLFVTIKHKDITYLKVDCETSEYKFLYDKDLLMIKYIGIELHHHMGIEKYNQLINWIKKTHNLINGDESYQFGNNKEVLYKLK